MDWINLLSWIAIVFLVGMSGLFSGLNLGLMGLDPIGLEIVLASEKSDSVMQARKIKPLRDRGNWLLCTLLLGNVAVNAALSILLADKTSGLVGFIVSTAVIVVFGEIIPQAICSRYALYIGAKTVYIVWFLMMAMCILAWPISWILDKILGEEIGTIYSNAEMSKLVEITNRHRPETLDVSSASIMKGALELNKKRVMDIYTEMKNVFWLNENTVLSFDILTKIFKLGHSRIPIFRASDDIIDDMNERPFCIGLLYVKDLILVDPDDNIPITKVLETFDHHRLPIDVWKTDDLNEVMQKFTESCQHLAFVKDGNPDFPEDVEYVGIVTLEDVIEEILKKELVDEYDNYVDHKDKKSTTHRLNEIDWENSLLKREEDGGPVDPKKKKKKKKAKTRKRREGTMAQMKPMPVTGHSCWPQMMTMRQPFMLKPHGGMSKEKMSTVLQQEMTSTNLHPLYFAIQIKSKMSNYGHQNKILNSIFNLKLEIIDFRSWHATRTKVTQESFYVTDSETKLPPTRHLKPQQRQRLRDRVKEIRAELDTVLGGKAQISIKRWLPGVRKNEDCDAAHTRRPSAEHDPQDAFKQAQLIMQNFEREQIEAGFAGGKDEGDIANATTTPASVMDKETTPNPEAHEAPSSRLMNSMDQSIQAGNVSQVLDDDMMQAEESRQISDDEAEMSYIYGDEDSSHHQLDIVDESASDSEEGSGGGYASNEADDEPRRKSTPPPNYDPKIANNASRTLEMKQVASSSVADDGD